MGPAGAVDDEDQREHHGNYEARQHIGQDEAEQGSQGDHEISTPQGVVAAQFFDIHQADHRVHHHDRQHRIGQILEDPCEEDKGEDNQQRRNKRGELRAPACLFGSGGLGEAGVDGEALKQAGADVGRAKGDQLLVGIDDVVIFRSIGARRAQ